MKFGSVKFFKALIITGVVLLLLVPLALAILFGILYVQAKGQAANPAPQVVIAASSTQNPSARQTAPFVPQEAIGASFPYQKMYPDLYVWAPVAWQAEKNVCYLTFDDGPSPVTQQVLDILAENSIKATFFVTGNASELNEDVLRAAAEAGHTIGVHTWSHEYETMYSSVEAYLEDFDKMYRKIEEVTGTPPEIFRFAGGSVNVYNRNLYTEIAAEMLRRGFTFYDWNAAASDAVSGGLTRQQVVTNVLQSAAGQDRLIVLLHDRPDNATTAAALPAIIEGLRAEGFRFAPLTSAVEPITYYYTS